ncbi:MAG: NADPH-dependent F420 reductase [Nitrosospira sp.]
MSIQSDAQNIKCIGIIGAGAIGQALASQFIRAGIPVTISNRRGPDLLASLIEQLGPNAKAGTAQDAVAEDIVVLAFPWDQLESVAAGLPSLANKIVIDAVNPVLLPGYRLAELNGKSSSEVVSNFLPGARLVKAFNTLLAAVLASDPGKDGGKRVVFVSSDDADAKMQVKDLIERLGFAVVDLGTLATGAKCSNFPAAHCLDLTWSNWVKRIYFLIRLGQLHGQGELSISVGKRIVARNQPP